MKLKASMVVAMVLSGLIPGVCRAQNFSADVVYTAPSTPDAPSAGAASSPHPPSKIYVGKDKMRLETRGVTGTILLVNAEEHTTVALFPLLKVYQNLAAGPAQYFRVEDAENACPDWQKAASQKFDCIKVGPEVVDGRQTVKYQNKSTLTDTATTAVWIDAALKFVVKWADPDNSAELRNITEGVQPADLFVVPGNYQPRKPQQKKPKTAGNPK
jgi:hypothetical protein